MSKEKKEKHFIKNPIYEGGFQALRKFISSQLEYPKAALTNKIEGTVYLKYSINHLGKVIATKVISSVGFGCDEEAERIVRLLKFKVPKSRGVRVTFHKNIQIHFRLPKQTKTKVPAQQIQYHLTKKSTSDPQSKEQQSGYQYTVDL